MKNLQTTPSRTRGKYAQISLWSAKAKQYYKIEKG